MQYNLFNPCNLNRINAVGYTRYETVEQLTYLSAHDGQTASLGADQ